MSGEKQKIYKDLYSQLRYYKKELPEINEYVMARVIKYSDAGIYCHLIEYNREAFLSFKNASSSKKLRNIKKQVIKNHTYILSVNNIEETKGFVDIEKKNISESEQKLFTEIITSYQKIFQIFVKTYIFENLNKNNIVSVEDIYSFLNSTLWRSTPQDIKLHLKDIHVNPQKFRDNYNLCDNIGDSIIEMLQNSVPKPQYIHKIRLKVNSASLDAVNDISNILNILETSLGHTFHIESPPIYYCEIISEYSKECINKVDLLENKVKQILKSNPKEGLYIDILGIDCSED